MNKDKEQIIGLVDYAFGNLFYYDRKEDEDFGQDGFADAIKVGVITYDEILEKIIDEIAFLKDVEVDVVPFQVEEEKCFILDYNDFDDLVNKYIDGIKDYEVVAYEEWNNDSSHMYRGDGKLDELDIDSLKVISNKMYKSHIYLNKLVELGVLPVGNYRIEVSW